MPKLTKGYAGSGKTKKLITDVYSLINNAVCSPYEVLTLTLTPGEKEEITILNKNFENSKNINIWSVDELYRYILKKSPIHFEAKIIPDFIAINIIGEICKTEFIKNSALNVLTKSNSFFRELYNLFGLFKNNEISVANLLEALDTIEISESDKVRLRLITNVFKIYNEVLEQNKYLDYRDAVIQAIYAVESNELLLNTLKSRFKHIFIDGFEDITYLQFKLLKLISNPDNLYIYGDEYSRIQEFRGAWRDNLILDSLNKHFQNIDSIELNQSHRNAAILQRAIYLVKRYDQSYDKTYEENFSQTDGLRYRKFEDVQAEVSFIAQEILEKVKNDDVDFSDFAVLIRDFESKQKFIDLFKTYGIPINSELYVEDYQNFKTQLLRYLDIFNIFEELKLEEFSTESLKAVNLPSKAKLESLFNELNLYFENVLSEILEDQYIKDQFMAVLESQNGLSLINVVGNNIGILKDADKDRVLCELEFLANAYKHYRNQNVIELIILIAKKETERFNNASFTSILGKVTSKTHSLLELYKNVLNKPFDYNLLREIVEQISEEETTKDDAVNLLTFFKTAGYEYRYVYIPCLTENNFPKKDKSTYFISPDSNEKVSQELRKVNDNFRNIIELDEDGIKEESRLFYLGMTRAKESLTISTHIYQDKKQIQPSVFFQALVDKENLKDEDLIVEIQENQDTETLELTESKQQETTAAPVLKDDDVLKLNASSIGYYQACPRKFFYSSLLNMKEESHFAASYGSIAHSILEVFNNKCIDAYNKENLLSLCDILFDVKSNQEKALEAGFSDRDIDLVIASDDLNLAEMKEHFYDAVKDLDEKGFLNNPPGKIITEKGFEFTLEDIPNVVFDGRIDAIYQNSDEYRVIDYKTGKDKFKDLSYYLSDYGVNFQGDYRQYAGVYNEKLINEYEYQIPLYYLACQNAEELKDYKDKVSTLGLKYIRPTSKDGGCRDDEIDAAEVESRKEKIIQNLKETIVDKIKETQEFEPNKGWMCKNCSFGFICDEGGSEDDE